MNIISLQMVNQRRQVLVVMLPRWKPLPLISKGIYLFVGIEYNNLSSKATTSQQYQWCNLNGSSWFSEFGHRGGTIVSHHLQGTLVLQDPVAAATIPKTIYTFFQDPLKNLSCYLLGTLSFEIQRLWFLSIMEKFQSFFSFTKAEMAF